MNYKIFTLLMWTGMGLLGMIVGSLFGYLLFNKWITGFIIILGIYGVLCGMLGTFTSYIFYEGGKEDEM